METIRSKKDPRKVSYREKIYVNGKAIKSPSFKKKADAVSWKAKRISERDQSEIHGKSYNPTLKFEDYLDRWLESKKSENVQPRTMDAYSGVVNQYLKTFFKDRKLSSLIHTDGIQLRLFLNSKELKPGRINFVIRVLKQSLKNACEWDLVVKNPFQNLDFLKEPERAKRYWKPDQIQKFLCVNSNHELIDFFEFALNTGLRRGELLGLCWDKVDFDKSIIEISRTVDRYGLKETTKTGRIKIIPLNLRAKEILERLYRTRKHPSLVFTREDGRVIHIGHISERAFKKAILKAELPVIRLHDLRTTFASNFAMNDGNIFALSKLLGHSTVNTTTKNYAHLNPNYLKKEAEVFSTSRLNKEPVLRIAQN